MNYILWALIGFAAISLFAALIEIISEPFPHPDECWDCKKGSCDGCEVIR